MAVVYQKQLDEKTKFALWRIEETAEELLGQLQLKEHETAYLGQLTEGKRYLHWLSTRVLLRKLLETPGYIDCQIDEHGKPYLKNYPYYISLSHSLDYAAVMISEDKEVGIDIEQIQDKIGRIANKFMKDSELTFVNSPERTEQLYVCWCAKEAIYKLQGKRNVSFKDHIDLRPFTYKGQGVFRASLNVNGTGRDFDVHYEKFENYMIGYCSSEVYEK